MGRFIALLRGINVGGKNRLPMTKLVEVLHSLGFDNVQTYIQSGNAVFDSRRKSTDRLARLIADTLQDQHQIDAAVLVLSEVALRSAVENDPFRAANPDPKTMHFFFLSGEPQQADESAIKSAAAKSEQYELIGSVFYLLAPDGIGRSKLAANAERYLGVPATARNLRSVEAILALATSE